MEKHEKIYVLHDPKRDGVVMDSNYHVSFEGFGGPTGPPVEVTPRSNVIVLSVEELRDLWNHCANCQVDKETEYANEVNFTAYLQSKGIAL